MLYLRLYDNTRLQAVCLAEEIRVEESIEAQRSDAITAAFSLVIHCNQDATTSTLYMWFLIRDRTIFHPVPLAALLQLQSEAHQESSSADYVESNCMSRVPLGKRVHVERERAVQRTEHGTVSSRARI
ncbi:hypothetical protein C0J45_13414 [Silurus meridionalis]|uniref:Uncharacterized protein n=1 Tax=Silurus meridionalis TaxID=175797 RepID=A0A8T0AUQ8_SILME|nr:hypothetical protein HF521_005428 [Silurus meridionalis]KAI5096520.1 hypothetical protein C0J45_13414 [Silurus meridionalis]